MSKVPPKKVLKRIYKKILKSSGQFTPHKLKRKKGNQPHLWLVFIIKKTICDIALMHYSNCFIDIEPLTL